MTANAATYDLVLLLSMNAPDEQRAKVLTDVESAISSAGGAVERNDDWGRRPMTFQIRHQAEAEYHLLQFSAPGELIGDLSHTLRITDGVLRSRIIKVRPGTPPAPSSPPPVVAAAASSSGAGAGSASSASAPAAAAETPPAAAAPPPAPAADEAAPAPEEEAAAEPAGESGEADQ